VRARLQVNLGVVLEAQGQLHAARDAYAAAASACPHYAAALKQLGGVQLVRGSPARPCRFV
jgi:hypothetical protein